MKMDLVKAEKNTKDIIDAGADITGSAIAGAASGFLLSGPPGAITGALAGGAAPLLKRGIIRVTGDIAERFLSQRERTRIGGVINYANIKIHEKFDAGEKLRDDGFFELPLTSHPSCPEIPIIERPPADEVIEGLLLAVEREHEEWKLPFQGNLLANIFFNPQIDRSRANLLVKLSQTISFRQMCILSIFSNPYKSQIKGRYFNSSSFPKSDGNLNSIFQEAFDLGSRGLLYRNPDPISGSFDRVTRASHLWVASLLWVAINTCCVNMLHGV